MIFNKKVVIIVFLSFLFIGVLLVSSDDIFGILNNKIQSPDSEFSSQKIITLNITEQNDFEKYINIDILKINETRFMIEYDFNESLKQDIKDYKKQTKTIDGIKVKYKDLIGLNQGQLKKLFDDFEEHKVEELTSNIKVSKNEINLSLKGYFYVDLLNYDSEDISSSVGEQIKIGENSITIETIESTNNVGQGASVAIDSNNIVHISHLDSTNDDLRYCNNTGGSWTCTIADTSGFGLVSSIAIDSNDVVHISYIETTNNLLRYCNNTGGSWTCDSIVIDVSHDNGEEEAMSSIAIDSNDIVHISYVNTTGSNDGILRYCNNTGGSWTCVNVTDGDDGYGNSIVIDSNDITHISYCDGGGGYIDYCNNTGGSWTCATIYRVFGSSTGSEGATSISIDSNDVVHVSANWLLTNDLIYMNNSGGIWTNATIENIGFVGIEPSIAIDSNDIVHISHYDSTSDYLRYCNNIGNIWSCDNIVQKASPSDSPGRAIAIKKGIINSSSNDSEFIHIVGQNRTDSDLHYINFNSITTLNTPQNNSWNNTLNIYFNCSVFSAFDLSNITLYVYNSTSTVNNTEIELISGSSNYSVFNITLPREDTYEWNCYICDTNNNCSFDNSNFTLNIDIIYPQIKIITPTNHTNSTDNTLNINYTRSDTNLDSCWYSNDSYVTNTTLTSCTNITGVNWTDDNHNVTIWVNDSSNNVNHSFITFTIDTINPNINITFPSNHTNSSDNILNINYTTFDTNLDSCWYSNDSYVANTTLASCINITGVNWTDARHNITIWINDSVNNVNKSTVTFTIDTIYPTINISSLNVTAGSKTFEFFANTTDTNNDTCWYGVLDIGEGVNVTNTTYTCNTRITPTVTAFGTYNLSVWANDSANNVNSTRQEFTTTAAVITIPGGGGGTTVIIGELGNWSMTTDVGTEKYQFNMIPGRSRTKKVLLENFEDEERTIEFLCANPSNENQTVDDLCEYLALPVEPLILPVKKEIKEEIEFTLTIPEDLEEGIYITNIVGLDDLERLNILTIETNVGQFGFITEVGVKLGSSREIFGVSIPYLLLGFFSWLIFGVIIFFAGLRKVPGGFAFALVGGLIGSTILLLFI